MIDTSDGQPNFLAWGGCVISVFFLVCAVFFTAGSGSSMFVGVGLASGLALAYSLIAVGQAHFSRRQRLEEENLREQQGQVNHGELFTDSADDAVQLARRLNRNYMTYAVPVLALVSVLVVGVIAVLYWRYLDARMTEPSLREPFRYAVLSLGLFVVSLLSGSYYVGRSREQAFRWLRPVGAVWILTGIFFLIAGVGLIAIQWNPDYLVWDLYITRVLLAVVMILVAEAGLAVIVDFYRPRVPGESPRPSYESRVLTVFTEPGGVARNIAMALDYQFGFQVSEARFYHFLERTLIPLIVFMAVGMWLMTCIVVIDTEETGIRERFGRVIAGREEALESGLYFKLPLPFERIRTFPTARMHTIPIGYKPVEEGMELDSHSTDTEIDDPSGRVILWNQSHNIEETNFVVAAGPQADMLEPILPEQTDSRPVPVYFMAASIPLYYEVEDLYTYLYEHKDANRQLEALATREVITYMATVDFFEILTERKESARILRQRIQDAASRVDLGVKISFVGLEGLHPPVRVGSAFNQVVSAAEEKHTQILKAEQYGIQRRPQARSESLNLRADAKKYKLDRAGLAEAEAVRFLSQLQAFRTAPELYPLRAYLDVWERKSQGIRKYVVGLPFADQVMTLNLEEKLRPDLLDLNLEDTEE